MNAWMGIGAVLGALAGMMLLVRAAQRRGLAGPETGRKLVHLGMGLICAAFPWIFRDVWPVVLLALCSAAGLAAVRRVPAVRAQWGGVLGGVNRVSLGEFYFPAAVALVWSWSGGDPFYYSTPIVVLALADTAGALVGQRYGTLFFGPVDGRKSLEGSLAVGGVALACIAVMMAWLHPAPWDVATLTAVGVTLVVVLTEGAASRGLDNLLLPVVTFFLLRGGLALESAELAWGLAGLGLFIAFGAAGIFSRARSTQSIGRRGHLGGCVIRGGSPGTVRPTRKPILWAVSSVLGARGRGFSFVRWVSRVAIAMAGALVCAGVVAGANLSSTLP